ncbi:hypothetical protein [Rhodobacter sp. SY28-1]|uniref:hypothetical protein n=1 Tax=Rhodobacter sp. SY28-1 TaxID=2562317 RepID=UPI001485A2F3|nr:hypothetical protein [Rhodobacter sp. SY28-1]
MSAAEWQVMAHGQEQLGPQPVVTSPGQTALRPAPAPGMLDPLIRALDHAVVRSAQQGTGCGTPAARD